MTKLEEVARAIYLANPDVGDDVIPWEKAPQDHDWCFSAARAAVEALRTVNEAMRAEGQHVMMTTPDSKLTCLPVLNAMIDAILSEGE